MRMLQYRRRHRAGRRRFLAILPQDPTLGSPREKSIWSPGGEYVTFDLHGTGTGSSAC